MISFVLRDEVRYQQKAIKMKLTQHPPFYSPRPQFVMVSRVTLLLRGLGHAIGQERSIASCWKERALTVLRENNEEEFLNKYK